jgi:prevent-host-death family protein
VNVSKVSIHEAKAKLSGLIEEALSGGEVIIMRRNTPLVRIVPLESGSGHRHIGSGRDRIHDAEPGTFIRRQLNENAIQLLPIEVEHCARLAHLPPLHKDPFDRLMVCQALHERIPLISADPAFVEYGLENLF